MALDDPDDTGPARHRPDRRVAASRYAATSATFVEALAVKLEEAVPGAVTVERRREGMFGPKLVRRIAIDAGGQRLELRAPGGRHRDQSARASRAGSC